ncbi:RAD51D-like protein 1 [Saccharomyces pastorianus]|uniref:RAD51D-like protein 1 n=1 Tax=Saccharomyces pastorianus TaxID=27292 RepID=A0A6C1E9W1_SACPS|nr:RAD51D-like protein 1 [Saccharomyces pastorianus]
MWKAVLNAWNGTDNQSDVVSGITSYKFEDMKRIVEKHDPNVVLVDVREPSEYSVVRIPGSINVPYRSHPDAFALDSLEFKEQTGIPKPDTEKELIFYCASGKRGDEAQKVAHTNGYSNTSLYPGSMNDWVAHGGDKLNI